MNIGHFKITGTQEVSSFKASLGVWLSLGDTINCLHYSMTQLIVKMNGNAHGSLLSGGFFWVLKLQCVCMCAFSVFLNYCLYQEGAEFLQGRQTFWKFFSWVNQAMPCGFLYQRQEGLSLAYRSNHIFQTPNAGLASEQGLSSASWM
jgi:hypothetical protein